MQLTPHSVLHLCSCSFLQPRAPSAKRLTKEEKHQQAVAEALANGTEPPPALVVPVPKPPPVPRKTKAAAREAERKAAQLLKEQESDLEYNNEVWSEALEVYNRQKQERVEKLIRWEENEEKVRLSTIRTAF